MFALLYYFQWFNAFTRGTLSLIKFLTECSSAFYMKGISFTLNTIFPLLWSSFMVKNYLFSFSILIILLLEMRKRRKKAIIFADKAHFEKKTILRVLSVAVRVCWIFVSLSSIELLIVENKSIMRSIKNVKWKRWCGWDRT